MVSIIIPAHNEATVIGRCLESLTLGAQPDEIEVIVVCNGCRDDTALVARRFGNPVRVIETDRPSKANALNLGDAAATRFPRLYVDADVLMSLQSVCSIAAVLRRGDVMAASPAVDTVFPAGASWFVRAYYALWMALPHIQDGMMAAGVYAVSREGRQRFGTFPDVIADDGYVRLLFSPGERVEVAASRSTVVAPASLSQLIRIKTRSRVGVLQLRERFPDLYARAHRTKQYGRAFPAILGRPDLYVSLIPYLWVSAISRVRAHQQARQLERYTWERDDSSR